MSFRNLLGRDRNSFVFGGNTGDTYESLQRKRKTAEGMAQHATTAPRNLGEGLSAIGNAILYRRMMSDVEAGEKKGREDFAAQYQSALGGTPSASVPAGGDAVRAGLIARGLPEHIADGFVMNFQDESGLRTDINEQSPIVPGSRGGYGLAQWTGPRRNQLEAFASAARHRRF